MISGRKPPKGPLAALLPPLVLAMLSLVSSRLSFFALSLSLPSAPSLGAAALPSRLSLVQPSRYLQKELKTIKATKKAQNFPTRMFALKA